MWGGCGVLGLSVYLQLYRVKRYSASSRQGLREGVGRGFVRVDGLCSA